MPAADPPRLEEVLLDDVTWDAASRERRSEWRSVFHDLLAEHRFAVAGAAPGGAPLRLFVTSLAGAIVLDLRTLDGEEVARAELPLAEMAESLKEYFDICREMGRLRVGDNSPRLEALDIAKRIVHDEGGELVMRLARALAPDHATSRRLFTLAVTLRFDTTRLLATHPT